MWTKASAILALQKAFGEPAVAEFMQKASYEPHELADAVAHLNTLYGIDETKALFECLGKPIPELEVHEVVRAQENLGSLVRRLWSYTFQEDSVLDYIEVGTNHIVLYPKPTDVGRRFLACLVATMWNPANERHFDPYVDLKRSEEEHTYAPVLDHAGYQYSNPSFNLFNGPDLLTHLHPRTGGSWHTHFYYDKQFPGLLAMYSVLKFVHSFIDEEDTELKEGFEYEMMGCINQLASFMSKTILDSLPATEVFYDNPTLNKAEQLKALFLHIQEKGMFHESILDYDLVDLTEEDYAYLEARSEIHGGLWTQILKNFLFDLKTYRANLERYKHIQPMVDEALHTPTSPETVKALFKLTCCLNAGTPTPTPPLSVDEVSKQKQAHIATRGDNAEALAEVPDELLFGDLMRVCDLTQESLIQLRRMHFSQWQMNVTYTQEVEPQQVDNAMVGYRSRVAQSMHMTATSFKFSLKIFKQASKTTALVDRTDTKKAVTKMKTGAVAKPEAEKEGQADVKLPTSCSRFFSKRQIADEKQEPVKTTKGSPFSYIS